MICKGYLKIFVEYFKYTIIVCDGIRAKSINAYFLSFFSRLKLNDGNTQKHINNVGIQLSNLLADNLWLTYLSRNTLVALKYCLATYTFRTVKKQKSFAEIFLAIKKIMSHIWITADVSHNIRHSIKMRFRIFTSFLVILKCNQVCECAERRNWHDAKVQSTMKANLTAGYTQD